MAEMILELNTPGMTSLHKAGLAGLYMTLKAFENKRITIKDLSWDIQPDKVVLHWEGVTPKNALEGLMRESFKIDNEGFFRFAGLEINRSPTVSQRHHLYRSLLNTFLKQSKSRDISKIGVTRNYVVDEKSLWLEGFKQVEKYNHKDKASELLEKNEMFKKNVEVIGWLYPGGIERHSCLSGTRLMEPIALAFCLWFAPVGCVYFGISSKISRKKTECALLVPAVRNLEEYSEVREYISNLSTLDMTASGTSDALLRFLILRKGQEISQDGVRISKMLSIDDRPLIYRVFAFGSVPWNKQERSRTMARSVATVPTRGIENYSIAHAIFKNRWQHIQEKRNNKGDVIQIERDFVSTPCAREIIAENIAQKRSWYNGIADYMSQKSVYDQLLYEQKEIHEMIDKADFDEERERIFIRVCYEAWRRHLGKLGSRAKKEPVDFGSLARKDSIKLRASLLRSKNAESLRETVVSFWSRAGTIPELQGESLMTLLPLFNDKNWRKSRDLALLALVSYQPKTPEETAALAIAANEEEEI